MTANVPFGLIINVGEAEFRAAQKPAPPPFAFAGPAPNPHARGKSAFVYVPQKSAEPELFDFINVTPRTAGRRVRLHKDHTLDDMTTFVLIYEAMDRYCLAETLSHEVHRRAGSGQDPSSVLRNGPASASSRAASAT